MSLHSVDTLLDEVRRIRTEPNLAYQVASEMSLEEILKALEEVRGTLVASVEAAPDSAFEEQRANGDSERPWSVGEVVGHSNQAALNIAGTAMALAGSSLGDPPAALAGLSEPRVMSREEATAAARELLYRDLIGSVSDDATLDQTENHDFFGTMSGRSWLYFIAMHEADHVNQIREFSA